MTKLSAFHQLCRGFHQDLSYDYFDLDEMIDHALLSVDYADMSSLKSFMDKLLDGSKSPEDLKMIWLSSPASITFSDGESIAKLLTMVRKRADTFPYPR